MNYFPIKIRILEGPEKDKEKICNTPEDVPNGIGFKVVKTRVRDSDTVKIIAASFKRIFKEADEIGLANNLDDLADYLAGYLSDDLSNDTVEEWQMDFEDGVLDSYLSIPCNSN